MLFFKLGFVSNRRRFVGPLQPFPCRSTAALLLPLGVWFSTPIIVHHILHSSPFLIKLLILTSQIAQSNLYKENQDWNLEGVDE